MTGHGRPTLVVVSGPPGSGKTTLARRLAAALGCPLVCRDEIKQGMVHANPGFVATFDDALSRRTLPVFFGVVELLVRAGVTVVAESAFADRLWRPGLEPLTAYADLRVLRCVVDPEAARTRLLQRLTADPSRAAHADREHLAAAPAFVPIDLPVPTLEVDTSTPERPSLEAVLAFVNGRG